MFIVLTKTVLDLSFSKALPVQESIPGDILQLGPWITQMKFAAENNIK